MKLKKWELTVLCENSVAGPFGPFGLIGEHGWAVHVKTEDRQFLFDTGQGQGLLNNSRILGVDLAALDGIVISHGHYDHTSGLPDVLAQRGEVDVYVHPDCFLDRYWEKDGTSREIGIRFKRGYLESLGARFREVVQFSPIAEGIYLTGEVSRQTDFELPDPNMKVREKSGAWGQDALRDDQSLVLDTEDGLVVVLGCAHAGLINILTHVAVNLPERSFHTVIGGTHLGFAGKEQFAATVDALHHFGVKHLGASHCTGLENAARLFQQFGKGTFFAATGTRRGS